MSELHRPSLEHANAIATQRERERLTSGVRLSVALMIMVTVIVAGLTGLMFLLVSSVFESTTPSVARDLEWKALRGAVELSKTAELGLVVGDGEVVRKAAHDYLQGSDVVNVVALGEGDALVFEHGGYDDVLKRALALPETEVHRLGDRLVAWAPASIEGQTVGRVAVAVSTDRLRAGDELRGKMFTTALVASLVAMLLAFGFVVFYIVPVLRLTEAAFRRLEHTTELALEAARLKAQFLANMSHEIRTPMNAVIGLSKLMLGMPLGPKVRRYAERIDTSSRSLLNIINDILDFSKLEAGKYEIHTAPCEAALVVQEVAEILAERAQNKGIDLVYRVAPDVPRVVEVDADRLKQVLTNLVGNAVKFTECGEVFIQLTLAERTGDQAKLHVEVRDSGIGIPEEVRGRLFESFSQADGSLVRKYGGTGLGLAISKQLVTLMGGEVGVESEIGKGSSFWFTLPVQVVEATTAADGALTPSLGKRGLILCDNAHAATSLCEHALAWGMSVSVVQTEAEAVAQLQSTEGTAFDLVLISETQSGTQSATLVASLRTKMGTALPPVVVLSQLRPDSTRSELDQEVAAQLAQPVRMSELYECLTRVLLRGSVQPHVEVPSVQVRNFHGAKVLVVDDNEMNQFVAAELLQRFGCTVDQAFNGREAVDAVLRQSYALVLMDCQMPVLDGYAATQEIRAREPAGKRTAIVALTAHALDGERERVLSVGMDDYLTKPVRPQTLQRVLSRWIKLEGPDDYTSPRLFAEARSGPATGEREDLSSCASALLEMFLDKVPMQLELLDAAMAGEDAEELRAQAHKLKGSLLAVTAHELAELAHKLQLDGERRDLSQSEAVFGRLLEGFYQLERQIKQELQQRTRAAKGVSSG